ncbi:MAG: TonB-dependent receptor [Chitinophagia bacterium]|jgi:hemoglobin/transferrin/lactoferrin receptor protein|nr:TonB-dependent receptor [Chitinophagia bacterium]NCA30104.1 TonB-dependent receptor [Chitinophagia bacterium]
MFHNNKIGLFTLLLITSISINAQVVLKKMDSVKTLSEVVVYANKFPTASKNIIQTIGLITDKTLIQQQATTADILTASGQVFVQKSQLGGGSPIIRGFEASRVLLMVDGVRMNSAIFRAGHLQNIITVDNMILDRVEINYGPSSTMYGSDALGGVVNLFTKNPTLNTSTAWKTSGNAVLRYANGQNENRQHIDVNIANNKWAYLTSFTSSSFGDLRQGNNRLAAYPDFGKRLFYVTNTNGIDIANDNSANVNIQKTTSYTQTDLLQKIMYKPTANTEHLLNIQLSNSSDINRYDRLTETSKGLPVYSEWYYGPQIRNMLGYKYSASALKGYFQELTVNTSYQHLEESRISRKFKSTNKDYRVENVDILGVNADLLHKQTNGNIHFGLESYYDIVKSTAYRNNISTSVRSAITTRYSDGPTNMAYQALYLQQTKYLNDHWVLNDGIRLNMVQLNAQFKDTSLMHFPFTEAKQSNAAFTGNLGLAYNAENGYKLAFGLSSGFRAPNIDDLTKVFDTKTGYVVVPNKDLKPEYTYNAEVNLSKSTTAFSWGASLFYTWFKNALVADKFTWNGQSKIIYQGVLSDVYATQNKAKAIVYGFNVNGRIRIMENTDIAGTYTYTKGTYNDGVKEMPLDHIPPSYGRIGIKHTNDIWNAEVFSVFNGWKHIEDYNLNGEDNEIYATKDGMPGWMTLNFASYYTPTKKLSVGFQIENIADLNYRYFASGISAVGRNYILSCRYSF